MDGNKKKKKKRIKYGTIGNDTTDKQEVKKKSKIGKIHRRRDIAVIRVSALSPWLNDDKRSQWLIVDFHTAVVLEC